MPTGKNILQTVIDHDSGKALSLAAYAMKQAQGLLQRPTTSPRQPEPIGKKTVVEEAVTSPVEPEQPIEEMSEAVTTAVSEEPKIIEKEIINEKPTVEFDSSNTNVKSSKKVITDYSISQYNNPGNIEQGIKWEGLAEGGYGPNQRFAIFTTPEAGIRALKKDLTTKLNRYNGDLRKMIEQYAPESENDVQRYLEVVQQTAGVKDVYTEEDLDNIVKGFIRMENKKELADKYISLMEK
jgi:hypothetical protein